MKILKGFVSFSSISNIYSLVFKILFSILFYQSTHIIKHMNFLPKFLYHIKIHKVETEKKNFPIIFLICIKTIYETEEVHI